MRVEGVEKSFHRGVWPLRRTNHVLRGASPMHDEARLAGDHG